MQALVVGQAVLEGYAARHLRVDSSPAPGHFDRSMQTLVSRADMMVGGAALLTSLSCSSPRTALPRAAPHRIGIDIGKSALRPALEALDGRRHRLAGPTPPNAPLKPGPFRCTSAIRAPISATHGQSCAGPWTGRKVRLECVRGLPRNGPWAPVFTALAGRASSGQRGQRQVLPCVPTRRGRHPRTL